MTRTTHGLVALVTGCTQGIGEAVARLLASKDFRVIGLARTESRLREMTMEIGWDGYRCNVADAVQVEKTFAEIRDKYKAIDVLVNNAGIGYLESIESTPPDRWNEVIQTNLTGAFLISRQALPFLKKSAKAHVFNICSTASRKGFENSGAYCASKFGLLGFTEVMREEWRPVPIKVTAVIPGAVHTPFWNRYAAGFDRSKMLVPSDVAEAIWHSYNQPSNAVTEEIVIRPACGDL